jgi:restriction system protein
MGIPKFHETFLPILQVLKNGEVLSRVDLLKRVRDEHFSNLSPELLDTKTRTGTNLLKNRISWGFSYLKRAEIVRSPQRGMVQITEKGKDILAKGGISFKELRKDPQYCANQKTKNIVVDDDVKVEDDNASPEDMINNGVLAIETQVRIELLERLKTIDPYYFERVVLTLLQKMGYGDFIETAKSGDGGIDGIINQDQLGLEKIYVQAKRYNENKVHETDIRNFIGAMSGDTSKGIFVTTSTFDSGAEKKAKEASHKIILIDGLKFVELMYRFGVGVQSKFIYEVKQIDEDFFESE